MTLSATGTVFRTPKTRWTEIPKMLQRGSLDALVTVSSENVVYTSGHFEYTLPILRDRISATIIPAEGEPTYLVVDQVEGAAKRISWIKDVATYKENAESPIQVIAQILCDKGFARGKIAVEDEMLSKGFAEELQEYLPQSHLHNGSVLLAKARSIKTDEEVAMIEAAVKATERAHFKVLQETRPGDSEIQLARRLRAQTLLEGADYIIHGVVSSGLNTQEGHHIPDDTPLKPGVVIQTDTGGLFAGYCSDISRLAVVGQPNARQKANYQKLHDAQRAAVDCMRPGVVAGNAYDQIRGRPGWEDVWFYGHSLGVFVHDVPMLTKYHQGGLRTTTNLSATWELQPNMMFMVELALNDPEVGQRYTFEDLVLVTENEPRILSTEMDTTEMFVIE
jgi:Xaa-Pro aminopeptidase